MEDIAKRDLRQYIEKIESEEDEEIYVEEVYQRKWKKKMK